MKTLTQKLLFKLDKSLPFKIFFYFKGRIPVKLAGTGQFNNILHKIYFRLKFIIDKELSPAEHTLKYLLLKKNIECVLAEYGVTAAESLKVIQTLNLPLVVHFHGFDASDRNFLRKYKEKYVEVFQYAAFVVSVSKKMSGDLIALGCPPGKIVLNTYGPS